MRELEIFLLEMCNALEMIVFKFKILSYLEFNKQVAFQGLPGHATIAKYFTI
jgi:hypothetical protein